MSRCQAFNKNNRKCRTLLNSNLLFCCSAHEPINKEIMESCFMCMEKIECGNEIIYFRCKHAFHKQCYKEWLSESTYDTPICMICRNEVLKTTIKKDKKIIKNTDTIDKIYEIFSILHKNVIVKKIINSSTNNSSTDNLSISIDNPK